MQKNLAGSSTQAIYPAKCQMKQSLTSGGASPPPGISSNSLVSMVVVVVTIEVVMVSMVMVMVMMRVQQPLQLVSHPVHC